MKGTIIFDLEGTLIDSSSSATPHMFISEKTLQELQSSYQLALVTGASKEHVQEVFQKTFLGEYFSWDFVVTRDDVPEPKATGKPFLFLLEKDALKPYVLLGDSEGDRLGSAIAHIPFIYVDTAQMLLQKETGLEIYIDEAKKYLIGTD